MDDYYLFIETEHKLIGQKRVFVLLVYARFL